MARRLIGSGAFATSFVVHALGLGLGAFLLSSSLRERARAAAKIPSPPIAVELDLPTFQDGSSSDAVTESAHPEATDQPVSAGGGPLERHPDTAHAGHGGSVAAHDAATNLASSIDPLTLERDPLTHPDRSQVSRLRTANERRSLDDHRATPNPMQLTFLATGRGAVRERRDAGQASRGSVAGGSSAAVGAALGSASLDTGMDSSVVAGGMVDGERVAQNKMGAASAAPGATEAHGAAVLLARPWVMRARPALPTETRDRPNDTTDSSQAVASRVAALIHASTLGGPTGPGVGGEPAPGTPGRSGTEGQGSRTSPSGFGPGPDTLNDPGIQGYIAGLKKRVDDELTRAFPEWAIAEGRSGHIIFEMALGADGKLERVRLVRPSGIGEYDGNVMTGVRRIASFGPLPRALGQRALITMSYDSLNHVISRDGPGPGGYGSPQRRTE